MAAAAEEGGEFVWRPETEIHLFHALQRFKPVGMHKHVRMCNVYRYLNEHARSPVPMEAIWERINAMYDLALLDALVRHNSSFAIWP